MPRRMRLDRRSEILYKRRQRRLAGVDVQQEAGQHQLDDSEPVEADNVTSPADALRGITAPALTAVRIVSASELASRPPPQSHRYANSARSRLSTPGTPQALPREHQVEPSGSPANTADLPPRILTGPPPGTMNVLPPATTAGPPSGTTAGSSPATTAGPPPETTAGPPPATTAGPPPETTAGPPPATAPGPPAATAPGPLPETTAVPPLEITTGPHPGITGGPFPGCINFPPPGYRPPPVLNNPVRGARPPGQPWKWIRTPVNHRGTRVNQCQQGSNYPASSMRPFPGAQASSVDFTSDVMWDDPASFMFCATPTWRPPPLMTLPPHLPPPPPLPPPPFYRREKQVPSPSKNKTKRSPAVQPTSSGDGMRTRSKARSRTGARLEVTSGAASRTSVTRNTSLGKMLKKSSANKVSAGKVVKKAKKPPAKSAEQVAEEVRLSAMKNTAKKIMTLLKKPKPVAAPSSASNWLEAPERNSPGGVSGPQVSRNLLGELEFSSRDWQAIGSGGLGSTDTTDLVPKGDSDDDDMVEIIERRMELPEVISITGEDDSDWEDEEQEEATEPRAVVDQLESCSQWDPCTDDPLKITNTEFVTEPKRSLIVMSPVDETSSERAEAAGEGADPMFISGDLNVVDRMTAEVTVTSPANTSAVMDGSIVADDGSELDEFDAADLAMRRGSDCQKPLITASSVGASLSPSFKIMAVESTELDTSDVESTSLTLLPRLKESPMSTPPRGEEQLVSGPGVASCGSSPPERKPSSALWTRVPAQPQPSPRHVPKRATESEMGDPSKLRPFVRIKREPDLDDAALMERRDVPVHTSTPPVEASALPTSSPPTTSSPTLSTAPPRSTSVELSSTWPRNSIVASVEFPAIPPSRTSRIAKPTKPSTERPANPPGSPPPRAPSVPDDDSAMFSPPDAGPPSPLASSSHGRKRRVSDTQTSPGGALRLPVPAKRVRSASECSALAEPVSRPPPPPPPPPPLPPLPPPSTSGAAGSLVRRLMRMGKESLRTVVDDPSLLRSRHMMSELIRAHKSQQARRMELERFSAAGVAGGSGGSGGSGGGGSPARRNADEELPVEVLSDIRRILETEDGRGPAFPSSPLPRGMLSADRLGVTVSVDDVVEESASSAGLAQVTPTLSTTTVTPLNNARGRVTQSVAAAFARRVSETQRETSASVAASSSPRREASPGRPRLSSLTSILTSTSTSTSTSAPSPTPSRAPVPNPGSPRPVPAAAEEAGGVKMASAARSAASTGSAPAEDRGRFAALNGSARFAALDGSAARPGSAVSASVQSRARSPPRVVVSAAAAGAQRGKAPPTTGETSSGDHWRAPPPESRSFRPNVGGGRGGGGGGGRKPWECRSCFAQSWTNTCRIFRRHVTVIEKDVDRLTADLSSRGSGWDNLLRLSMVENQLLGQVEEMEEQVIVLQGEMRRLRQISRHLRDVRIKCMKYGNDVRPEHFALPPEVQQLLRRLAKHAPGAAPAPAGGETERTTGDGEGDGPGAQLIRDATGNSGERSECGHGSRDAEGTLEDRSHSSQDQGGTEGRSGAAGTDDSPLTVPAQCTDGRGPAEAAVTAPPLCPGGVRVKQEKPDPPAAAPPEAGPAAQPQSPAPPPAPLQMTAEVKPDPAAAPGGGDEMEVDDDEVSLARAMVRVRNESELNEMAAALLPDAPPTAEGDTTQNTSQDDTAHGAAPETAQEPTQEPAPERESEPVTEASCAPAMAYLGHIDSSSDMYSSLLALAQHNGNQVMLQVAPDSVETAAVAATSLGESEDQEGDEEPRMSVAEMATVKMEPGDEGAETPGKSEEGETGSKTSGVPRKRSKDGNEGERETEVVPKEAESVNERRKEGERKGDEKGEENGKEGEGSVSNEMEKKQNDDGGKTSTEKEKNGEGTAENGGTNSTDPRGKKGKHKKKKHKHKHKHKHPENPRSKSLPIDARQHARRRTFSERLEYVRRLTVLSEDGESRRRTLSDRGEVVRFEEDLLSPLVDVPLRAVSAEDSSAGRAVSGEDVCRGKALDEEDAIAIRTQLDDLGVPIVSVKLHGPCVYVLTVMMVVHQYTLPASFIRSLCTLQPVCDTTPLWSARSSMPRPRPTCMAVKQVGQRVSVLIGDDTGSLTMLLQSKPGPSPSGPTEDSSTSTHAGHTVRRVQVGSAISSLAHKAGRLYIGGDAFFAIVNVERLLAMNEFPERDGRPLPLRYWPAGDVLLQWRSVDGDVACVRPFHAAGADRTALCLPGRPMQIRDGLDGELLSTVGARAADQGCHLVTRWGHALYTVRAPAPAAATGASCCLSAVDLESSSFAGAGWRLLQPVTSLDADGDTLYVGHQDGSLRLMRCVEKAGGSSGSGPTGISLRSVQQLRSVGSAPLQAMAARAGKVVTGSSSGLVEIFTVPDG